MIEKAKKSYPNNTWIVADASKYVSSDKFDIVFFQCHNSVDSTSRALFKKMNDLLNPGGVLAISVPRFDEMPISKIIQNISSKEKWKEKTKGCAETFTRYDYKFYYELLSTTYQTIEFWKQTIFTLWNRNLPLLNGQGVRV